MVNKWKETVFILPFLFPTVCQDSQVVGEGKFFFIELCWLINEEEMKLKNEVSISTFLQLDEIRDLGSDHQWLLMSKKER